MLNGTLTVDPAAEHQQQFQQQQDAANGEVQFKDLDIIPTVEEKMQLSYDIFKVTNSDMARVLTIIEKSCPSALSRKLSADEVVLNFDAMTPRCFHEVNEYVVNCTLHSSSKKNKKKRPLSSSSSNNNNATGGTSAEADGGARSIAGASSDNGAGSSKAE